MSDVTFYLSQIIDGIAYGSIYGIFALSIVILYRANKIINFSQTETATLSVIAMLFFLTKMSYGFAFILTLAISFVAGALLHITVVRIFTEKQKGVGSRVGQAMVTLGFFSIFSGISAYLMGDEPQPFPSPFGSGSFSILEVGVSNVSAGIIATTLILGLLIHLGFKYTNIGLVFEAVAEDIDAARLRGIYASNVLALAWGVTAVVAAIGAVLIAPTLSVTPPMLESIFAYSLFAVVIGGMDSPVGAFVGGILVGVVENLASNISFIGSGLKFVVVFVMLLVILLIRPRGLWGRHEARRV